MKQTVIIVTVFVVMIGMTAPNAYSETKLFVEDLVVEKYVSNLCCMITCLLYTSPSPRDRTRCRMPSSA